MRQVDVYLTRKAQAVWPTAMVFKEEIPPRDDVGPRVHFALQRKDEALVDLGGPFGLARQALYALRNAARQSSERC